MVFGGGVVGGGLGGETGQAVINDEDKGPAYQALQFLDLNFQSRDGNILSLELERS